MPIELYFSGTLYITLASLWIVLAGSALTCWLRLRRIAKTLTEAAEGRT